MAAETLTAMTDVPYTGATPEQLRHHLVQEFLAIHTMFRDELANILRFAEALQAGTQSLDSPETRSRIQTLIRAGTQYTYYLHHHHHLESSGLFPALAGQGLPAETITRLVADHDEIGVLIDRFHAAVADYAALQPAAVHSDLNRLADALRAHLAYEETHVCPFIAKFQRWPFM